MDVLHYIFLSAAIVFLAIAVFLAVILYKRFNVDGTLCFTPNRGGAEPNLYVELKRAPRLYMGKNLVVFKTKIIKFEGDENGNNGSRNSHFT